MGRDRESKSASSRHHHESSKKSKKSKKHSSHHDELPRSVSAISKDDYFLRATEFRVWLAKTNGCVAIGIAVICRDKYVEDLSTEEATTLFCSKFVKKWNRGELDRMYYKGIPEQVLEQTKRTKHTWGFVKRLDEKEVFALATARDSVGVATRKSDLLVSSKPEPEGKIASVSTSRHQSHKRDHQDSGDDDRDHRRSSTMTSYHKRKSHRRSHERDSDSEDDGRSHRHRASHKAERKKHRKHHESMLEELAPKETGREAQIEKRRQVASKMHGAARDREENRDGLDLSEDFLMGGATGDSDLQRRLKQREQTRGRKQQEAQEKLATFEAKESARMDKFLQDMGISASSKPFTIAPRK